MAKLAPTTGAAAGASAKNNSRWTANREKQKAGTIDVLGVLPHGMWREIIFPIVDRSVRFAHEGTDHQIIYRNGVAVEMTGAGARVITYTIPFRSGVTKGPYGDMFSKLLQFWHSYHDDRSPGPLYDPVYGELNCVPQEWDETSDPNRRDGVDVRVSFKEDTPPDGAAEPADPSFEAIKGAAVRLDDALEKTPWGKQVNSDATESNIFSSVAGVIQRTNASANRLKAKLSEVTMRVKEVEDAAAAAEKTMTSGAGFLRQEARTMRRGMYRVTQAPRADLTKRVRKRVRAVPSTITAEAQRAGMTVQEFIDLNPELAKSLTIPANTPYLVYLR